MNELLKYIAVRYQNGFTGSVKIKGMDICGTKIDVQFNITQGNLSRRVREIKS